MSNLTVQHAGSTVTTKSVGNSSGELRAVIRINPTVSTTEYVANDAVFNSIEIPNAVLGEGGVSRLEGISVRVESATTANGGDMMLLFSQKAQANLNDTLSSGVDITVDEVKASNVLGVWHHDQTDSGVAILNGTNVGTTGHSSGGNGATNCLFLKAEEGSTSVYVSGTATSTWTAAATDALEIILNIQY